MGLFRRNKNNNKPVIRQIIDLIPSHLLRKVIQQHGSDKGCHKYKTYDQLVALLFGQLCRCSTLEDISVGIGASKTYIRDLGLQQSPAKSTMSDGNKKRDYKVFESLYMNLLTYYHHLLKQHNYRQVIEEVKNKTILIRDSSTISLCLGLFDWAKFRTAKGGIKIHTQWDEAMMLPNLVNISEAAVHDRKGFEDVVFPKGTIIIEDKGYWDFSIIKSRIKAKNDFVTRIKDNTVYEVVEELELPKDTDQHILIDEIIHLTGQKSKELKLDNVKFRRVVAYHEEKNTTIEIISNNLDWSASTIAELYRRRWDIETFFKLLKQNLNVKTFVGTSENAVKAQIFVALITYLLLELLRRVTAKGETAFSNFVEKIRICLSFYLSLDYVINQIKPKAQRAGPIQANLDTIIQPTLF
ncbi:MAG: IS4 family transposase [Flavobacteriales bacterium]|nr:IS4 family transposase [Bacteroidota bacterium]NCQ15932.1 IS4 family transposase [Flavobacteriales bacterium]